MSFWNGIKDGVRAGVRNAVIKLLDIQPAQNQKTIVIKEPLTFEANVLRNRLWYRGDPSELDQFFKATIGKDPVAQARFWAAVPSFGLSIRKIHSGLPGMVADQLEGLITGDLSGIDLEVEGLQELWDEISKDNEAERIIGEAINDTLVAGDGAFKITVDPDISQYPLIEFFSGEQVEYTRKRGRLQTVVFLSDHTVIDSKRVHKDYHLRETYGKGYVKYELFNSKGTLVPLSTVPELADLQDVTFAGDYIMAVPMKFFKSPKWKGRGKSLFDSKTDPFDALDEVISQWQDAIRSGRVNKYIPDELIPKDPKTGALMQPNPFDNQFIALRQTMNEKDRRGQVDIVQPEIAYEAFLASYTSKLDMCIQGIISPSTLGIDVKKMDNAEAQREKEKATLYTRTKVIDALNKVIPQLVDVTLKTYDTMKGKVPQDYVASVTFGEYAAPDFGSVVVVVAKARTAGIMSIEQCVEELYGDRWTDEEKAEEVARLKAGSGLLEAEEPKIGDSDRRAAEEEGEGGKEGAEDAAVGK